MIETNFKTANIELLKAMNTLRNVDPSNDTELYSRRALIFNAIAMLEEIGIDIDPNLTAWEIDEIISTLDVKDEDEIDEEMVIYGY